MFFFLFVFFCQAEDGIRDLVRSRGLGDVYKRQVVSRVYGPPIPVVERSISKPVSLFELSVQSNCITCLLYTSDAADERSSVDLGGRRIIKKKNNEYTDASGSNKINKHDYVRARYRRVKRIERKDDKVT